MQSYGLGQKIFSKLSFPRRGANCKSVSYRASERETDCPRAIQTNSMEEEKRGLGYEAQLSQ